MGLPAEKSLYIIGAGFAGQMIAEEIKHKKIFGQVAAFIDDNPEIIGKEIDGIPVLGPINHFMSFLRHSDADEAIIAMPSAPTERIKEVYDVLTRCGFTHIRILPAISQVIEGKAHLVQAREIDPLDILGRTPITISLKESLAYLRGKRVLITGAGGSIGSELARQLLSGGAERLYLFGHGENSIYLIDRELRMLQKEGVGEKATIVPVIGDLKDREYMHYILKRLKADVVFHCAAYKHVPLMEENPVAVIQNNVFGTRNILDASIAAGVSKFVLISTDKAVAPVSVYGVSKMLCENLLLDAAAKVRDRHDAANPADFMFVRFGNVLGSRGSVLTVFMSQIKNGGPLTVTDRNMQRYFMTIPEACSLVLKTGGVGRNGIPYMLDMGEPVNILDLAEQCIRFSGFEPYKDIDIAITGFRKGERLDEPLWLPEENPVATEYPKIMQLTSPAHRLAGEALTQLLEKLDVICNGSTADPLYRNKEELISVLAAAVPSYDYFLRNREDQ
ncbi:MAG: polysaccharide biosynthesis protein [Treponemataceae bacterium]|nr:polysaccharide biosynthesis protein [Treponemataceae bacterium]